MSKKNSLYFQGIALIIIAGAISAIFFFSFKTAIELRIDTLWNNRKEVKRNNDEKIESLQEFISENHIATDNISDIGEWCGENREVFLEIYDGNQLIFSSEYYVENKEVATQNANGILIGRADSYYDIDFADGSKQIFIIGMYSYESYNAYLIADIIITFLIFVIITMLGIRSKINYINILSDDVQILEGGDLDYEVSVRGNDEITNLAKAINAMGQSLGEQFKETEEALYNNRQMVTEISHDLRTPLTSILLYAEILKKDSFASNDRELYLDKMIKKVNQMKVLSDHLLEYSIDNPDGVKKEARFYSSSMVLYDELSDMCSFLEAQGYEVEANMKWSHGEIFVKPEYISRILDNISSNIMKYASENHTIMIYDNYTDNDMYLYVENKNVDIRTDEIDTHGIGIRSIQTMMSELDGSCTVEHNSTRYQICLRFQYRG